MSDSHQSNSQEEEEEALSDLDTALLDDLIHESEVEEEALIDLSPALLDDVTQESEVGDDNVERLMEVDACGEVDEDIMRETEDVEDVVVLSSDEEEEGLDDVSLVLLKRPPVVEAHEATIEILDSDEEFPVVVAEGEKPENVNYVEKKGRVEEFIEVEGLGIIYSEDHGLVLFHLCQVWTDGQQLSLAQTRGRLRPGAEVSFYDQTLQGEEYVGLSSERVLHQALVVWSGERPGHLMKTIDMQGPPYVEQLIKHRETFMMYVNGEVFLPCHLARVKGVVKGYISERLGVIECEDINRRNVNVFFDVEDVLIFKEPLIEWERRHRCSPGRLLPVGLSVSVDAREVDIAGVENLQYQAIVVLAGTWPKPCPIALSGGPGTYSQSLDVPDNMTLYYLELCLEAKLVSKVQRLKEELMRTRGEVIFMKRHVNTVREGRDMADWRATFTNRPKRPRPRGERRNFDRNVRNMFRAPPARMIKTKMEEDDTSSMATAGRTAGSVYSISEVASRMSRPVSRLSEASSCLSSKSRRDWYNPTFWNHGGLRIKPEIKSEEEAHWEPPVKRMKMEK